MPTQRKPSPAEAAVPPDHECVQQPRPEPQEGKLPRAGRTGGLGARAERPSEGSARKSGDKHEPVKRGAKAPSANASSPHSDERSSK